MVRHEPTMELLVNTRLTSLIEELDIDYLAENMTEEQRLEWIEGLAEDISWQTILTRLVARAGSEELQSFLADITNFDYEVADGLVMAIAKSSTEDERKELVWQIAKL